jgi:endoglucanase
MLTRIYLARLARSFFAMFLLAGQVAAVHAQSVAPEVTLPAGFATIDPFMQNKLMARGVNVLGYDPIWADFSKGRFKKEYFRQIHDAGFTAVRVNLQAFQYMMAENKLPDSWFRMLDWVVANATEAHLQVILDEHDFIYCGETSYVECKPKLLSFWQQVAPRYKDTPNSVTFEPLNEPHGLISNQEWNNLFPELLAIIRKTNPTRNVIIGPGVWNNRAALKDLALPGDNGHIIVTFHYYEPLPFTHQGAPWASEEIRSGHDIAWGKTEEQLIVERDFDGVAQWSQEHHRPILLGEFGAYDKAPMESRVRWDAFIRKIAEDRGFSWAYWQFDSDFVVYDVETNKWNEPILKALIPNSH